MGDARSPRCRSALAANSASFVTPEGVSIAVTEHLFAALWAAGIDHALIEVNRGELPNHDGSAITLYEEIAAAGRAELGERLLLQGNAPIRVEAPDGAYIELAPHSGARAAGPPSLHINYTFSHPQLGEQRLGLDVTRESAPRDILPARTFATVEEAEALIALGLLHNTHTDDAILMMPVAGGHDAGTAAARSPSPHNYAPSTPLRFGDEFARHKVLDLLGDIYGTGIELTQHHRCAQRAQPNRARWKRRRSVPTQP
jgi:UDP-3-O-acyl-N-acetylglucosamine deacetylase